MDLVIFDLWWMSYNTSLALLAIIFGILMLKVKKPFLKVFFGMLWLLFIPNTLYIVSDIFHLWDDWYKASLFFNLLLIPIYFILISVGVITFVFALSPFEKQLTTHKMLKKHIPTILFFLNFGIAFGIVLGRFQRINSWEVFTNPLHVISQAITVITSVDLLLYILFFGVLGNCIYFLYKKYFASYKKNFKILNFITSL